MMIVYRSAFTATFALAVGSMLYAQATGVVQPEEFPLRVTISSVEVSDLTEGISPEKLAEASADGLEAPYFVFFRGMIDGEDHWIFSCRKENRLRESLPCTPIPTGIYSGRWIFDHTMVEIVGGAEKGITRFLAVSENEKSPPSADDPLLQMPVFNFPVRFPASKSVKDYTVFAHIYGGSSIELPAASLPEHTRCNAYAWSDYQGSVNCTSYPAIEITRGYVTLDFSAGKVPFASLNCEAKWRWSHCSLLDPGLYYGRIVKNRLILLTHDANGKPVEVGFEVQMPRSKVESPAK